MPKPRVVVFDLGKVLLDFDYGIAARAFTSHCKSTPEELRDLLTSPLLLRYETGLISKKQFYQEVCKSTGFCGNIGDFSGFFADIFTPIEPMINLQASLRRAGIPTYIFSNTNELAIDHIRHRFSFFTNFDGYILSYEHGAMKPDAKLYEEVERQCGQNGCNILYLDDRPENIETAVGRGWQTILQETPEKTLTAVRSTGLLNGHLP